MVDQKSHGGFVVEAGNEIMKIKDAILLYKNFGDDFRPDLESLINVMRASNVCEPLENSNYLHALSLTEMMLRHTRSSFRMVTGDAVDGFLNCLRESFVGMLSRLAEVGGTARIILVQETVPTDVPKNTVIDEALTSFASTFEVVRVSLKSGHRVSHFIACDEDMVRDEEIHEPLTESSGANLVKAKVFFKNRSVASSFVSRFDTYWRALKKS